MKRSGFTMIELIFVIVILGILAAVAIPKLAATRDDAKIATKVQEATQFIQEASSYYTSHGQFGKLSDMSNVKMMTTENGSTDASAQDFNGTTGVAYLQNGTGLGCVQFTAGPAAAAATTAGSIDGNLTIKNVTTAANAANAICRTVQKQLSDKNISSNTGITHTFGGSSVTF